MATGQFVKKYPVFIYYVLVFLISWGSVLLVVWPSGMPAQPGDTAKLFPLALIAMLAGPVLTGLLMTGLMFGKAGFLNMMSKFTRWRVGLQWYSIAILLIPVVTGTILWLLSQTWPEFTPNIVTEDDKPGLLASGIGIGLAAGFFEEIGWTGFVVPLLKKKYNIIATGLIAGLLWGFWHFLVTYWASGDANGRISRDLLLPPLVFYIGVLPAYRVLMVWIYDRTNSLLLSMLMHASLTTSTISLFLPPVTGMPLINYYLILTAAIWALIANMLPSRGSIFQKQET